VGYRIIPGGDNLDGEGHGTHVGGSICGQVGRVCLTLASYVYFAMRSGQCGSLFKWPMDDIEFLYSGAPVVVRDIIEGDAHVPEYGLRHSIEAS
jgi:hypothetical protein